MLFGQGNLKLVNRGSNSDIYRCGAPGKSFIIKMVPSSCKKEARHLFNEFKMLSNLDHENILKVFKHKQKVMVEGSCRDVLVMENAVHGSLLEWFQKVRPSATQIRWVIAELCQGIRYLHCNYIVHRDLKLENVLVTQNAHKIEIKIGDFGFASKIQTLQPSKEYKGTRRAYMAPEIHALATKDSTKTYDPFKSDIFALGVTFFCLILGKLPFEYAIPENLHYKHIVEGDYEEFWKSHQPALDKAAKDEELLLEDFKQIFISMVHYDPNQRPSIEEVLKCSWLKGQQTIVTVN